MGNSGYYLLAVNISLLMAIFFLFIFVFSTVEYKASSFIIFLSSILLYNTYSDPLTIPTIENYTKNVGVSMLWDGATAMILTTALSVDKLAVKQALLLAFATTCHIMVLCDLPISSNVVTNMFYTFYDELIILVCIAQMAISHDAFTTALFRLYKFALWAAFGVVNSYNCIVALLSTRKKSEAKA